MNKKYINPDYIDSSIYGLSIEQLNQFNKAISERIIDLKIKERQCENCYYRSACIDPEIDYWLGDCLNYKEEN